MKNILISGRNIALAVIALFAVTWAGQAFAAEMVAHRAAYSLKLGAVHAGSEFVGARGNMRLSMERTCNGWTMSQNLRMDLFTASGEEVVQDLRFTAWESTDRTQYRFFASNNVNGVREDFRGRALMDSAEGAGNANYKIPKDKKIPLPEGTMFPLGHTAWLIERAMAGDRQVSRIVFDGADGEGPQLISAFIGAKQKPGARISKAQAAELGPLVTRPGWTIRMGFYEVDSQRSAPDYEVEILQLDNGITPKLTLDYQDFTVILTQERLEEIPQPICQ